MNELKIINEQEILGKEFRVYGNFDNPLFLAKDVAEWIENKQPTQMVEAVDKDEKLKCIINTSGQNREMWFLTEDGLYEVLMQSRKPMAKKFKKEVKTILKSLRKGETKLVSMTEYQRLMTQSRMENAKIRKAQILTKLADQYEGTYKQVLQSYVTKELTGEFILPLPEVGEKTYSATEIGNMLGVTANKIGKIANKHNLKTDEYGKWFHDKSANSKKEVETFRYYEKAIDVFRGLIEKTA